MLCVVLRFEQYECSSFGSGPKHPTVKLIVAGSRSIMFGVMEEDPSTLRGRLPRELVWGYGPETGLCAESPKDLRGIMRNWINKESSDCEGSFDEDNEDSLVSRTPMSGTPSSKASSEAGQWSYGMIRSTCLGKRATACSHGELFLPRSISRHRLVG